MLVPRKVLKRKYQGELEADETEDADDIQTDDGADSGSNIIEQSSISSSNHPYRSHNSHHSTQESESQGTNYFLTVINNLFNLIFN